MLQGFLFLLLLNTESFSQYTLQGGPAQESPQPQTINYLPCGCGVNAKFSPEQDTVVMNGNPVLLTNESTNAGTYSWYINGSYSSSANDITISPVAGVNEIMLVASNGNCDDTAYSYIIWQGAASGSTAVKKQFNPPSLAIEPFCMASDKANGYLLAGDYFLPARDSFESKTTCFIRVNDKGCVEWSKAMVTGEEKVIQSIIFASDTGFLVSAFPFQPQYANYPDSLIVFKLDKLGNIEWSHSYSSGTSVINHLSAICETDDKGFVLETGSFPTEGSPSFASIIKIDHEGRFTWGRKLGIDNNSLYNVGGIIEKNGFIYATGSIYQHEPPFQPLHSFLTQLDAATGKTNWTKQSDLLQPFVTFADIHNYKNGLLINSFTNSALDDLIYTDNDGNVLSTTIINNPYGSLKGGDNILVMPDNSLYFHQASGTTAGLRKDIIARLDSNQQILWQNDFYSQDLSFAGWYQLSPAPANGVAGIGSGRAANGLESLTFLKVDSTGTSCSTANSNLTIGAVNYSLEPMVWSIDADLPVNVTDFPQQLRIISIESHLFCPKYSDGCDLLKLEGTKTVCKISDTARYILHTDPTCPDEITWVYDSSHISVFSKSNSGMEVRFNSPGSYVIKVEKNGCDLQTDSIIATAGNDISGSHLPDDTVLCFGSNMILNPGNGYSSYLWQNGSTDKSISISTPGTYWVRLTANNGCMYMDTATITQVVPLPVHFLIADTVICSDASLLIQAPRFYSSYLWSTGEINSSIQIKKQGMYILQVVDSNGCTGLDTVNVTTKKCPHSIYFPNAFTPNNDGHNDLFKPIVSGNPVKYHFSIYNRWGQRVFDTTDPNKGWDGRLLQHDPETGTYVWTCIYQFIDEKENNVKGSFVLIR